jgi:hypothetical protein
MSLQNIVTLCRGLTEGQDQTFPEKKETKREERKRDKCRVVLG